MKDHEDMNVEDLENIVVGKERLYINKNGDILVLPVSKGYKIPKTKRLVLIDL